MSRTTAAFNNTTFFLSTRLDSKFDMREAYCWRSNDAYKDSRSSGIDVYRGGQLRDISEVSKVGVKTIQQFRHLGPFTHPLSSSPSVDLVQIKGL